MSSLEEVRYVPGPQCRAQWNWVNFGKVSGVIVDVCRTHGTWFDSGELTRVVAFAARGGLARTKNREDQERKDAVADRREAAAFRAAATAISRREAKERLEEWVSFLSDILFR